MQEGATKVLATTTAGDGFHNGSVQQVADAV